MKIGRRAGGTARNTAATRPPAIQTASAASGEPVRSRTTAPKTATNGTSRRPNVRRSAGLGWRLNDVRAMSVESEAGQVFLHREGGRPGLIGLVEEGVLQDEDVDVGGQEAPVGIGRGAHDRLASHVERRVDEDGAAGAVPEGTEQPVVPAVADGVDGLHPA